MSANEKTTETTTEDPEKVAAEIAKLKIDADKVAAEILALHADEARKNEQHELDLLIKKRGLDLADANAVVAGLVAQREQRAEAFELATNRYNYVYPFNSAVSENSVTSCIARLNEWVRTADRKLNIEIVFDSPGGSVIDGMHLFDHIRWVRRQGHHVTTSTMGMAASMAGILLQAGDRRVMGRESYLLVHEVAFGAVGKFNEVVDEVKFVEKIQERVLDIFADRAARAYVERGRAHEEDYDKVRKERRRVFSTKWKRTDWWLSSDEAYEHGLVDEVFE
jgi:ATP-dependent protease ClpP protease subunit